MPTHDEMASIETSIITNTMVMSMMDTNQAAQRMIGAYVRFVCSYKPDDMPFDVFRDTSLSHISEYFDLYKDDVLQAEAERKNQG